MVRRRGLQHDISIARMTCLHCMVDINQLNGTGYGTLCGV
jgi:hypothetical protein